MALRMKKRLDQTPKPTVKVAPGELPTFLEHIQELRRRLFWVVAVIFLASGLAYPFLDTILGVLTAPLGGQQLYYLTPIGGLSFSIKICLYVGILVAVPCFMYHLYRYLEPLIGSKMRQSTLLYLGAATVLAVTGVLFAYFVSLPGALHFLTGMELKNIQAMLTVDSYLGFVMTYLIGAALLFQIPLLLLIINRFTPLKPSKLMKIQRYVIVASFIIAAIISPTPDIMNQLLFALPIIAMYEIGVVLVWLQNRTQKSHKAEPVQSTVIAEQPHPNIPLTPAPVTLKPQPVKTMDGFAPQSTLVKRSVRPAAPLRPPPRVMQRPSLQTRSVDGFAPYRRPETLTPS
ncbi:MAG TPA: twin-arginine translocase subunit TatC [Magnetospirillaceae bacterium]|nr:twin-arginine translocase subunit TatC [Magnetospirillaceae bacterium]